MRKTGDEAERTAGDDSDEATSDRASEGLYYVVAVIAGAVTGVLGTAFHSGVNQLLAWPYALRPYLDIGNGRYLLVAGAIAATMCVASVWLVRRFAPEAAGSGVQEVEGAMAGLRRVRWQRVLPVKFFAGFLSLGSGLVVGREGPTIHIGASISQALSEWLRLPAREGRGLLAAGAAAGLATAFSAPLASILFVIEETRRQFPYSLKTYTAVMLAAATSGIVTAAIAGPGAFMQLAVPDVPLVWLPAFVLLGVILGPIGVAFNRALVWSMNASLAIGRRTSFYILPAVVGFAVGVLLVTLPQATMGGENLALRLIGQNLPLTIMAVVVVIRFVMTMTSYATGVPGGIFAPILSLATAIGLLFALLLSLIVPMPAGLEAAFAVAAMGGLFASTVRAPLVGVVLIAELTGVYSTIIPAILTCLFSNLVAEWLGGRPIYEVLLDRTLALAGQAQVKTDRPSADGSQQVGGWDQR